MNSFYDFVAYALKDDTWKYLEDEPLTEEQHDSVASFLIITDYLINIEEEVSSYDEFEAYLKRVKEWDARLEDSELDFEVFEDWLDETDTRIDSMNDIEPALNEYFQTFIFAAPEEDAFNVEMVQEYGTLLRELKDHDVEHLFNYDALRSILWEQVEKKYVIIEGWDDDHTIIYRFSQVS